MKIAVLMGGISSEREISLKTGGAILKALLELGYDAFEIDLKKETMIKDLMEKEYDLAFIALHGEYGEDGRIQAFLDILGKAYTGCGYLESAITIDKEITKKLLNIKDLYTPKTYRDIKEVKTYPVVVKPASEGSSFGLYICQNEEELKEAVSKLEEKKIMIEEFIKGDELTVGVLNGEALGVIKIIPKTGIYDFEAKYVKGKTNFELPAKLEKDLYENLLRMSEDVARDLNLKGGVRVDIILKEERAYFLEVNTIPGMTETSLLPKLASLKGYDFKALVKKIVEKFAKK